MEYLVKKLDNFTHNSLLLHAIITHTYKTLRLLYIFGRSGLLCATAVGASLQLIASLVAFKSKTFSQVSRGVSDFKRGNKSIIRQIWTQLKKSVGGSF